MSGAKARSKRMEVARITGLSVLREVLPLAAGRAHTSSASQKRRIDIAILDVKRPQLIAERLDLDVKVLRHAAFQG